MAVESKPRLFVCKYGSFPGRLGAGYVSLAGRLGAEAANPRRPQLFEWPPQKRGCWTRSRRGMVIGPIASGDMSKIDGLIEVARMLKDARSIAEECANKTLVYFLDMAMFEACGALAALRGPDSAYAAQKPALRRR